MVEEGDLVDDFFDDDARGVELVAGILLAFEHADAQAASGEDGRTCEAGEACADDGAIQSVGAGRADHKDADRVARKAERAYAGFVRGNWTLGSREIFSVRRPSRSDAVYSEVKAKPRYRPALERLPFQASDRFEKSTPSNWDLNFGLVCWN